MNTMTNPNTKHHALRTAGIAVLLVALGSATAIAGASGKWLHVRVEDSGYRGEEVSINIPLDMVAAFLPMINTDEMSGGKIRLDSHWDDADLHGIDLREVIQALRDAPDANFVTVRSDDENVRVSKEDGFIKIDVEDGRDERVRVRIPMAVVDALIGDDPYELDLMAAIDALSDYDGGDLVTVESNDEKVRIWIDSNEGQ